MVSTTTSATNSLLALLRDRLDELTLESRVNERTPLAQLAEAASGRATEGTGSTLLSTDRVDAAAVGVTAVATTSLAGGTSVQVPPRAACPKNVGRQQNNKRHVPGQRGAPTTKQAKQASRDNKKLEHKKAGEMKQNAKGLY
jgi:hypothetical protein